MKRRYSKWVVTIIAIVLLLMPLKSFAATTVSFFDGQVTIEDSAGKGKANGETGYTTSTSTSRGSETTNTITVYNKGEKDATISFGYTASSYNTFTIAGLEASESGNHSTTVNAGQSFQIKLTAKGSLFSAKTATLNLTGITYTQLASSSEITFEFDGLLGTVTAGGESISSGDTITVGEDGKEMVATPVSGAKFIAWVDEDSKIVSESSTYNQLPVGNTTIRALFTKDTPYFKVDKTYICSDLNEAASKGNTIVLMCDSILPSGDYVIPQGKTLLVPFDDNNTIYTDKPESVNEKYAKPSPYRTLTMEGGANITVNGAICVPAKQSSVQGSNGSPVGKYGLIDMKDGSTITVNSGGNLYAWGYITGSGKITAKSGATVYEDFQVRDWRGGNATTDMIDNDNRVFPMSQYYVQNIEVPLTLEAGAIENGYMSVYVSGSDILGGSPIQGSSVPFIGPNGMFKINSGSITKDYDEKTDRLVINIDGNMEMSSLSISMKISLIGTQTVNSDNYTLPVNGNITLHVNSGSEVKISQDMALLPGGVINVYKGAKCIVESDSKVFIYDSDNWDSYCSHQNKKIMAVNYAAGGQYTRTEADLLDAQVYVEGVVDASNGYVYVTESGANINGAEGGLVKLKSGVGTSVTYQATQSNTTIDYVSIPVTAAKIKNADGTYVDPELTDCSSEYEYSDGEWTQIFNHTFVDFNCSVCGADKIATKTKYSINGESIVINSSLILDVSDDTQIIIATYNSDMKLLEASCKTAATLEEITFSSVDVAMIKLFAWDAANIMTPISIVEEIEL